MTLTPLLAGAATTSPVAAAYTRLTEVFPGLRAEVLDEGVIAPTGAGWVGAAELAAGGAAVDTFLAWDNAQVLRDYGQQARPDVVASFGLHRYAWPACSGTTDSRPAPTWWPASASTGTPGPPVCW